MFYLLVLGQTKKLEIPKIKLEKSTLMLEFYKEKKWQRGTKY